MSELPELDLIEMIQSADAAGEKSRAMAILRLYSEAQQEHRPNLLAAKLAGEEYDALECELGPTHPETAAAGSTLDDLLEAVAAAEREIYGRALAKAREAPP